MANSTGAGSNDGLEPETLRPILRGHLQFLTGGLPNLQLDIVGFLAILGEGSLLATSQVSTLSKIIYIPRLLPAPQALLRPSRPSKLEPQQGFAYGIHSGNHRDYVNHVGHVLLDVDSMPAHSVRIVEVVRDTNQPDVKARFWGPLTAVAIFGCVESVFLLVLSCLYRDGMAIIAVVLLSFLSTLIGIGNKWTLHFATREKDKTDSIPGDVVIRHPKGSFLIVLCDEDVARELYFAPENINYKIRRPWIYRLMSLVGTLMLMFGVIFLGNSATGMQIAFAAAYMLLNAAYWIVAALPNKSHWDMSTFIVKPHTLDNIEIDPMFKENKDPDKKFINLSKTYTWALWKAIVLTKTKDWIRDDGTVPKTKVWDQWLHDALVEAEKVGSLRKANRHTREMMTVWQMPEWNPQTHLKNLIAEFANEKDNKEV